MLIETDEGRKWAQELGDELAWLKENHPDKKALIGLATFQLELRRMAGATNVLTVSPAGGPEPDWAGLHDDKIRCCDGAAVPEGLL